MSSFSSDGTHPKQMQGWTQVAGPETEASTRPSRLKQKRGALDYTAEGLWSRIKQPWNNTAGLPEAVGDGGGGDRAEQEKHKAQD